MTMDVMKPTIFYTIGLPSSQILLKYESCRLKTGRHIKKPIGVGNLSCYLVHWSKVKSSALGNPFPNVYLVSWRLQGGPPLINIFQLKSAD